MTPRITQAHSTRVLAADIREQQEAIAIAREQIASGKRINRPSDDPAHAARLESIKHTQGRLTQYLRNADAAESRLALEETALARADESLARIRELAVAAGGSLKDGDRAALRTEVIERLGELVETANAQDSAGDYIFAGSRSDIRPFEQGTPTLYRGDSIGRDLPIGPSRTATSGDVGMEVFMRTPTGNGRFAVAADTANTGTGIIDSGSVVDATAFRDTDYRIEFTAADEYSVIDVASGTAVQTAAPYTAGEAITFEGLTTRIEGAPSTGDVFEIQGNARRDMFTTIEQFAARLDAPRVTDAQKAQYLQGLNLTLGDIDQAKDAVNTARSRVGTRLQVIDSSRTENEGMALELARTSSNLEDVDVAEAITRLESRAFALEALQKSWARVENLSLFNYL